MFFNQFPDSVNVYDLHRLKRCNRELTVTDHIRITGRSIVAVNVVHDPVCIPPVTVCIPAPECFPHDIIKFVIREIIPSPSVKIPGILQGLFEIPPDISGTCVRNSQQRVKIALHFFLDRFHKTQNVILAIAQFFNSQGRPWEARDAVVKIIKLAVRDVHLFRKFLQIHVCLKIAAPKFYTVEHTAIQDFSPVDREQIFLFKVVDPF